MMIKILIVEDEEPISNLIRMNLTKAGYQCKCAFDGQEAADMIGKQISLKQEMLVAVSGRLFEQRIMGVIPFLLVCYVEIGNRGFFDVLYHNLTGVCIMTVCLVVYLVSQLISIKICQPVR